MPINVQSERFATGRERCDTIVNEDDESALAVIEAESEDHLYDTFGTQPRCNVVSCGVLCWLFTLAVLRWAYALRDAVANNDAKMIQAAIGVTPDSQRLDQLVFCTCQTSLCHVTVTPAGHAATTGRRKGT